MNPLDILQLALAVAGKAPIEQTISDAILLYGVEQKIKAAGKFTPATMVADGSLAHVVEAAERTLALLDGLLKDPAQATRVTAILKVFS